MLFQKATNHLSTIVGDIEHQVSRYWANIEADRFRSMEEARKIWSNLMQDLGDSAENWIEYINLEKMYGDSKHLRRLFLRALERTKDQPERISQVWLQFEREEGTLEQFEECERKVKARMKIVLSKRKEENNAPESKYRKNENRDSSSATKFGREKNDRSNKRKHQDTNRNTKKSEPVFKKPSLSLPDDKQSSNSPNKIEKKNTKNGSIVPPPPGFKQVAPPPGYIKPVKDGEKIHNVASKAQDSDTIVFVSNLDFSATEQQIREFFSISGSVEELRLIKNYAGKSKGFAYVHFSSVSEAKHALSRDKELLSGRPAYISKNEPDKKASGSGHQFQYSTELEKNKLFVKNLPLTTTKSEIAKLFSAYGDLKDVRLITYRNGHSKGMAYVEYCSESNASKALLKTDNLKIEDNLISVAISNPPKKEVQKRPEPVSSLGGVSKDNLSGYRGKGRSQIAFVPRSVQKSASVLKTDVKELKVSQPEKSTSSNADFRNMIFNKK